MLNKKTHKYFALEISENQPLEKEAHIKLWHFAEGEKSFLTLDDCRVIDTFELENIQPIVSEYIATYHLEHAAVGLILPRSSYVVRSLTLPQGKKEDLHDMITLQIGHMFPYEVNEVVFDFLVYDSVEKNRVDILLFIVTKQVLQKFLTSMQSVKINPTFIVPSTALLNQAFHKILPLSAQRLHVCVDINAHTVELLIYHGAQLVQTRNCAFIKGQQKTVVEHILFSVQKAKTAYPNAQIGNIFINREDVFELSKIQFMVAEPDANVKLIDVKALLGEASLNVNPGISSESYSVALASGLLRLHDENLINLLPDSIRAVQLSSERKHNIVKTLILVGAACLSCLLYIGLDFFLKNSLIQKLDEEINAMRPAVREAQSIVQGVRVAENATTQKVLVLEILYELYDRILPDMHLTYFEYDISEGIKVRGLSTKFAHVSDFVLKLQQSEYFEQVKIKFAKKRKEGGKEFTDFQINCLLKMGLFYD